MTTERPLPAVEKTITVPVSAARAFELFTSHVGRWWPLETHSVSAQMAQAPAASCAFDAHEGGEFFEIDGNGERHVWGVVECWRPGERLTFSWYPGLTPASATRVDIRFEAVSAGETRILLRHDGWEQRGDQASQVRDQYHSGWDPVLERAYQHTLMASGARQA
ncbi:MAG: SRPBCC domain-containing protein [Pseudomonadota bacterium]